MHPSSDADTWNKMSVLERVRVALLMSFLEIHMYLPNVSLVIHCPSAIFYSLIALFPSLYFISTQGPVFSTSFNYPSVYTVDPQSQCIT